jgi:hypothetical protein
MLFEGQELREIISRTSNEIELRNEHGRFCRFLSSAQALVLDLDILLASATGAAFDSCAVVHGSLPSTPAATQRSD